MFNNLDSKCGGTSEIQIVSYVDFGLSILLFVLTTPLTVCLFYGLIKHRHLLNRNYYLVVLNILLADCLMAILTDPMSISFHIKEALGPSVFKISNAEQVSMHFLFFFTNIVAVLSMAVLAVDRLGVMLVPFSYYGVMSKLRMKIVLLLTWLAAGGITVSYFYIGYIRFLVVFSFSTVVLTLIFMLITMVLLKRRLRMAKKYEIQRRDSVRQLHHGSELSSLRRGPAVKALEFTEADKKITKTFLWMLVLFVLNYVPCVFLVVYMNICEQCNCRFVHVMRDIIWITILASPLCRALNFFMRLTALRDAVNVSCFTKNRDQAGMPLNNVN